MPRGIPKRTCGRGIGKYRDQQAVVLDPRLKSLSFFDQHEREDAYSTVSDLTEILSTEAARQKVIMTVLALRRVSSNRIRKIDEEEHAEEKDELKMYLADKTKVDSGPLAWWQKN